LTIRGKIGTLLLTLLEGVSNSFENIFVMDGKRHGHLQILDIDPPSARLGPTFRPWP